MTIRERADDIVYNQTCAEEDAKALATIQASIDAYERKKKMVLAPNTINRILENITQETSELSRADYIEVLEELKDDIDTRLDAAQEDEARDAQELEAKRDLDGSEGE